MAAWQHPADPEEIVVCVANLLNAETPDITVTLAEAAPVGAVVEVWARSTSDADQSTIALDGTRTEWDDSLAIHEAAIYIVFVVLGVLVFLYYRLVVKLPRMTLSREGVVILGIILVMMIADVAYDGAGQVLSHRSLTAGGGSFNDWEPLGSFSP